MKSSQPMDPVRRPFRARWQTYRYSKLREFVLSDIIDKILARLPAYFAWHLNVQSNDISPADQSVWFVWAEVGIIQPKWELFSQIKYYSAKYYSAKYYSAKWDIIQPNVSKATFGWIIFSAKCPLQRSSGGLQHDDGHRCLSFRRAAFSTITRVAARRLIIQRDSQVDSFLFQLEESESYF